jgi:hypothetical protein
MCQKAAIRNPEIKEQCGAAVSSQQSEIDQMKGILNQSEPRPMMIMTPRLRKFALTADVTSSVGWRGAVAGFQALAIAAVGSREPEAVRGLYLAMAQTGWNVIVPFCLASLVTGLIMSWVRHGAYFGTTGSW